jgi:Na+/H+-dicarboxylate symporter
MTVIPLIVSMLVASVGSLAASGTLRRVGLRALVIALALVTVAAIGSTVIAQPILARMNIDRAAAEALQRPATATLRTGGSDGRSAIAQWFIDLVPANVIKAAVDDAMLPVIIFAVVFGLALTRVGDERRTAVLRVVEGIAEAMQRLVAGILAFAPFGVFALAVPLAARLGYAIAGAVLVYIGLVVALTMAAAVLLLYPMGIIAGAMSPTGFVSFCAPAQAVAFSSRSSLAALPAMVESAERAGVPTVISGFVLPIAAATFRFGAAVAQTVGVLFVARLYGVALSVPQLASVVATVIFTTFAVPGIPGGSILAMVPVLTAASLPIEGIGILLAVDTIPDMFRTTANVTGSMALAAALRKHSY